MPIFNSDGEWVTSLNTTIDYAVVGNIRDFQVFPEL